MVLRGKIGQGLDRTRKEAQHKAAEDSINHLAGLSETRMAAYSASSSRFCYGAYSVSWKDLPCFCFKLSILPSYRNVTHTHVWFKMAHGHRVVQRQSKWLLCISLW